MKRYLKILSLILCGVMLFTVAPMSLLTLAVGEEAITEAPDSYKGVSYDDADREEETGDYAKYNDYMQKDGRLINFYNKINSLQVGESLNVAYLGGSITNGSTASNVDETSYRCLVGDAITELVAAAHTEATVVNREITPINVSAADYALDVEGQITVNNLNSAYGATSSWNAVYRFKEDAGLDNGNTAVKAPDIAFIEFAYNDMCAGDTGALRFYTDDEGNVAIACAADYESIILQLYEANPEVEIIALFTTGVGYWDYIDYERYAALSSQRAVLRKYDIPYLYIGKDLVEKIKEEKGIEGSTELTADSEAWQTYFADQVHPNDAGHKFYADKISAYLSERLAAAANSSASVVVRNYDEIVIGGTFFDTSILKLNAKSERIAELYADYLGDTEYVTGWRHYNWKDVDTVEQINNDRHHSEKDASFLTIKDGSAFAFSFKGTSVGIWYNCLNSNSGKMYASVYKVNADGSKELVVDNAVSAQRSDTIPLCWRLLENAPEATYEVYVTSAKEVGYTCTIKRVFINGSDLTPIKHGEDVPSNLLGNAGFTKAIADDSNGYDVEGNFVSIGEGSAVNSTGAYFFDAQGYGLEGERTGVVAWSGNGMRQKVALQNGESYKLSLDYARNGDADIKAMLQVSIEYMDENGEFVTLQSRYITPTALFTYKEYTDYFTVQGVPENCSTYIKFNPIYESGKYASAYLDNVFLTKADLIADEDNTVELLADPDFENGGFVEATNRLDGWVSTGSAYSAYYTDEPLSANVRTGAGALKLQANSNWHASNTYIIVDPGKAYEYSFYARSDAAGVTVQISTAKLPWSNAHYSTETFTVNTAWTKYSGTFVAPSGSENDTLWFAFGLASASVYIDDASIKEVVTNPELLADPHFENSTGFVAAGNQTSGWVAPGLDAGGHSAYGNSGYYYMNQTAGVSCYTGIGSLRLRVSQTSWHAANTYIVIEPGKTYNYSFYAKHNGSGYASVTVSVSKLPYSYNVFEVSETFGGITNTWTKYSGSFVAPSGSKNNTLWLAFGNVATNDVFIDDASVTLAETNYATEDLSFKNYTLRLDGKIGLGFNVELNARLLKSGYAQFKVDGDTITAPLSEATSEADGTYTVYCPLTSVQANKEVKAQLFYADGAPANNVVATTVNEYIADLEQSDATAEVKSLAKATGNYTAFAEKFFAGEEIADENLDFVEAAEANNHTAEGAAEGVSFYGYDLVLNDGTDLRLYFKADTAPTFTVGGEATEAKAYGDGYYYVTIKNIAAHELTKQFAVVANEGLTVNACALSYANSVLEANYNENLVKLCKALYNYSNAAAEYRKAQ